MTIILKFIFLHNNYFETEEVLLLFFVERDLTTLKQ